MRTRTRGSITKPRIFQVSEKCCYYLKEKPCNDYAKESGNFPYMGADGF